MSQENAENAEDAQLRAGFNQEASLYQKIRPHYPDAVFDTIVDRAHLSTGADLLEIGPGTGQATRPLAERGYNITAVELGEDLAAVARDTLKSYPNVKIITRAFEDIELPAGSFDLVFAATALHWVRREERFTKPHQLLRSTGSLAVLHTEHVSDDAGDEFFFASQPTYRRFTMNHDDDFHLPRRSDLKPTPIDEQLFKRSFFGTFPLTVNYTGETYAELLSTFSPTLAMDPATRRGFLTAMTDLINRDFGGSIDRHVVMTLTVAHKRV